MLKIRIKKGLGKNFLILDVGMNDLMRPSLYESYHHIIPMKKLNSKRSNYDIVGPVCESSDIFGYNRNLNEEVRNFFYEMKNFILYHYNIDIIKAEIYKNNISLSFRFIF